MIFKTEEDVTEWVKQNYSEEELRRLRASCTASSGAPWALVAYKGIMYEKINTILRENPDAINTDEYLKEFQKLICDYSISTEITVYRFVSRKEYCWLDRMTRWGRICTYNGFLSTTLLVGRYRELYPRVHRRMIIKIIVPKGTKGVFLPEVNPGQPEFEVLFPHGTRLKRIGIDKYAIISD